MSVLAASLIFATVLLAFLTAEAAEKSGLDWYLGTGFPDYELSAPPPLQNFNENVTGRAEELITNASKISGQIGVISSVTSSQPYVPLMFSTLQGVLGLNATVDVGAMFQAHERSFVQSLNEGSTRLGPREILVPSSVASYLGLRAGLTAKLYTSFSFTSGPCMDITCPAQPAEVNVTIGGVYEPIPASPAGFQGIFPWAFSRLNAPVILNLSHLGSVLTNLTSLNASAAQESLLNNAYTRYDIIVDRAAILDPSDSSGSSLRLSRLRAQIVRIAVDSNLELSSQLETAYHQFIRDRAFFDLAVLVFVSPVAILGASGGILLGRTEALTRYRDFFVASARGASNRLLLASLGMETLIDTTIALLLGATAAFLAAGPASAFVSIRPPGSEIILAGVLVTVSVSATSKAATVLRILHARGKGRLLESRVLESSNQPSTRIALALLAAGMLLIALTPFENAPLVETTVTQSILFGIQRDWFLLLAVFAFIYGGLVVLLFPWRRARKSQDVFSTQDPAASFCRAAFRTRKWPERSLLAVATLAVAMAVLLPGIVDLDSRSLTSAVYSRTGGDILLLFPGSFPNQRPGSANPPVEEFANVSGVESISFSSTTRSPSGLSFVFFLAETYLATIRSEAMEYGAELRIALSHSTEPGAAVANVEAAESYGLIVGATFGNLTITGVVPRMPGIEGTDGTAVPTLFTSYQNGGASPNSSDITRVLVRVLDRFDALTVQSKLVALDQRAAVEDAPGELQTLSRSPVFASLSSTTSATVRMSALILAATLAGSLLASSIELRSDFARMRARGLSSRRGLKIVGLLVSRGLFESVISGLIFGSAGLLGFAWSTGHLALLLASLSSVLVNPFALFIFAYATITVIGFVVVSRWLTRPRFGASLRERVL